MFIFLQVEVDKEVIIISFQVEVNTEIIIVSLQIEMDKEVIFMSLQVEVDKEVITTNKRWAKNVCGYLYFSVECQRTLKWIYKEIDVFEEAILKSDRMTNKKSGSKG